MNLTRKGLREVVRAGMTFDVTNHYIGSGEMSDEARARIVATHPCYGTRRRTVTRANTTAFYYAAGDGDDGRVPWMPAEIDEDGVIRLYGHPVAGALWLTLVPVSAD